MKIYPLSSFSLFQGLSDRLYTVYSSLFSATVANSFLSKNSDLKEEKYWLQISCILAFLFISLHHIVLQKLVFHFVQKIMLIKDRYIKSSSQINAQISLKAWHEAHTEIMRKTTSSNRNKRDRKSWLKCFQTYSLLPVHWFS